jgi:Ca-activated chloride channel family protein
MSKKINILTGCVLFALCTQAQEENKLIRAGNKLYKQGQYEKALPEYEKAVTQNPKNPLAFYNLGNAQFRGNDFTSSEKTYDNAAGTAITKEVKQQSLYNKGVSLSKQKKLQESIDAYKQALRMNPQDTDNRFNLEKALSELKKQQQQQQQQQPKEQEKKKKQEQQKQQPKEQPKQNLDKKKIEQYLKSLEQKEQEVQRKMQQSKSRAATQPEKDW